MKRLTERDEYGNADIIALSDIMPELYAELSFSETNALTDALNRLAAYEETGLTPEEVGKMEYEYSELFQAHLQYLLDCRDDRIKQLEDECHKLNKLIDEVLMRCKRATKGEQ